MGVTPRGGRWVPFALALFLAGGLPAGARAASPELPAPTPSAVPEAAGPPSLGALEALWHAPDRDLGARVAGTRRLGRELGLRNLEPLARALLVDRTFGSRLERARGAVELAPELPAAHAALASALWAEEHDLPAAAAAAFAALEAVPGHLEATLWFGASGLVLLACALVASGIAFLLLAALLAAPHAAHDLGDGLESSMPGFARVALLGALVLAPAAAGEGALGAGLVLFGLAFCYGKAGRRSALLAAALLVTLGMHPVAELAGRFLTAPGADPIAEAAYATENGIPSGLDLARLEHGADGDPLARSALALHAKRSGALREAEGHYRALLASAAPDAAVLNNAANLRLALGDAEGAIALYRRGAELSDSALIWFNLSQAYGREIRVEEHEQALARAQALDGASVRELTRRVGVPGAVVMADLPLPASAARTRLLRAAPGPAVAAALRRPLAPGRLGSSPWVTGGAFAAAALLAAGLGMSFRRSAGCRRCGARLCPRCRTHTAPGGLCEGCARLRHRPDTIDPALRRERLDALRRRAERRARLSRIVGLLVPGAAGLLLERPLLGLTALVLFCGSLASGLGRHGLVPDPLATGLAGPLGFGAVAATLAAGYLAATAAAFLLRRRSAA